MPTTKAPALTLSWLDEPLLEFGDGGRHVDPKEGIARYGPYTLNSSSHPAAVRVGLISSAELSDRARTWLVDRTDGVPGDEKNPRFPGFATDRGFLASLEFATEWDEQLTSLELRSVMEVKSQQERFDNAAHLLQSKLRLIAERDRPPDCVFVVLPEDFVRRCRVADYFDKERNTKVHRDLRRAFKANAMRYGLPTQLIREQTVTDGDGTPDSKVAWNLFTGLYTKAGGHPWAPVALQPASCFIGVGFYRPLGDDAVVQSSVVQAFDEHGEGLVMRGESFEWDPRRMGTPSPHLSEQHAHDIVQATLARYQQVMGQQPRRVIVHKTSRFWTDELNGFQAAASAVAERTDFLALTGQSKFRAVPPSKYPPLRGTRSQVGGLDYLYTTGFVSALGEFHGMHVPAPLEIADHIGGDTSRTTLLEEVLTLTKLNWNSAALGGRFPITLRFSNLVGEILRELPDGLEPLPQFKFYI